VPAKAKSILLAMGIKRHRRKQSSLVRIFGRECPHVFDPSDCPAPNTHCIPRSDRLGTRGIHPS